MNYFTFFYFIVPSVIVKYIFSNIKYGITHIDNYTNKNMVSATPKNAHRIYGYYRVPYYNNIQSVIL